MNYSKTSIYNQKHYNLIVSFNEIFWEQNVATFSRGRFLEHTHGNRFEDNNYLEHYNYLTELVNYPCLFLYEKQTVERYNLDFMGYIGYIEDFSITEKDIIFNFVKKDLVSLNDINTMSSPLQIKQIRYEQLNRTHWSVKNTNLFDVIDKYRSSLENQHIVTRPTVFFSYSWEEEYTSNVVEELYKILKGQGVNVVYDKRDLKPGHNMNYFMESVRRDDFTKIYVFCDQSYINKADGSKAGVGIETNLLKKYVNNHPTQSKVIPLSLDGSFDVPIFLSEVKGFSLNQSNWNHGVDQIINDIFE